MSDGSFCNASVASANGFYLSSLGEADSTPCVVLFFDSWTLDSAGDLALGCFGVCLLGFLAEAVSALSRYAAKKRAIFGNVRGRLHRLAVGFCFLVRIVLAFLGFLAVVTFCAEIFLCLCLGFLLGHLAFDSNPTPSFPSLPVVIPQPSNSANNIPRSRRTFTNNSRIGDISFPVVVSTPDLDIKPRRKYSSFHL